MGNQRWVRLGVELAVVIVLGIVLGAADVETAVYALVMAGVVVILVGIELVAFKPGAPGALGDDESLPLHEAGFVPEEREARASTTVRRLPPEPVEHAEEEDTLAPGDHAAVDGAPPEPAEEEPVEEPVPVVPVDQEPEPEPELEPEPEPEPEPEREPEPLPPPQVVPPLPPEPEPEPEPAPPRVTELPFRGAPREWNLWDLERRAREHSGRDPLRDEERAALFVYLREYASPDGMLPIDFDDLVRESFGDLLTAAPH